MANTFGSSIFTRANLMPMRTAAEWRTALGIITNGAVMGDVFYVNSTGGSDAAGGGTTSGPFCEISNSGNSAGGELDAFSPSSGRITTRIERVVMVAIA